MSLYGTGRREGIVAVGCIALCIVAAHVLMGWLATPMLAAEATAPVALLPALGGALMYRFLRAQGRSRYAAFLCGMAYGLSPWLLSIAMAPREQLAAALAPLALEAACRCDRPLQRRQWLPWSWLCLSLPFLAGMTVIGLLAAGLAGAALLRTITCGDRDESLPPGRGLTLAAIAAALAAAQLIPLDPLGPWLGATQVVTAGAVLTPQHAMFDDIDAAALLRVPGAMLLCFAALGLLRRQRHVDSASWIGLLLAGALPTLCCAYPSLQELVPMMVSHPQLPASALWLCLLAATVLGAAGLDDFLDQPMRHRSAHPWFVGGTLLLAIALPAFGSRWPQTEWPLSLAWVLLMALMPLWRRLGVLRFKTLLSCGAVTTLLLPLVQTTGQPVAHLPAAPMGEMRMPPLPVATSWHIAGLAGALVLTIGWALSLLRHRRAPARLGAAQAKKRPQSPSRPLSH